ncbi:hypothetical protein RchiOBHm_Chr5g0072611 [Rosa chinensis]|uniref:Uncharacterized protein n=1 Tax=Rosa chinensis TaxID=74649 RepID=A0A2P6QKQ8_ROSCH|nr:hypothetical protein RchiOBHm_Chr5g0072611 [Rosa chinensis]
MNKRSKTMEERLQSRVPTILPYLSSLTPTGASTQDMHPLRMPIASGFNRTSS